MKEQSPSMRKAMPGSLREQLSMFEMEVDANIASGGLDDLLVVSDADGSSPVVSALAQEPLSLLLERISAIGGSANIFIRERESVAMLVSTVSRDGGNSRENVADLSDQHEWLNGNATIGTFLDYLRTQPHGVRMPASLPYQRDLDVSVSENSVEMDSVPVYLH